MHVFKSIEVVSILTLVVILGGCAGTGGTVEKKQEAVSKQGGEKEQKREVLMSPRDTDIKPDDDSSTPGNPSDQTGRDSIEGKKAEVSVQPPPHEGTNDQLQLIKSEGEAERLQAEETNTTPAANPEDGCAKDNFATVDDILSHTKMLLSPSSPAEDEIPCKRMFIQNSKNKRLVFNFKPKSWEVQVTKLDGKKESIDLDELLKQAGKRDLYFVIRVAYEMAKKQISNFGGDSPEFDALRLSFPASEIDREAKLPDGARLPSVSKLKSYTAISGNTKVYWGIADSGNNNMTFIVETSPGSYTTTTISR